MTNDGRNRAGLSHPSFVRRTKEECLQSLRKAVLLLMVDRRELELVGRAQLEALAAALLRN